MKIETPMPWDEKRIEKFWPDEKIDSLIPQDGFIHDFLLATRGYETPSIVSFWSAIFMLSSVIKREAWFTWHPFNLYPNFYIIIVAPPRINAKTTALRHGEKILFKLPDFFQFDIERRYEKTLNILQTKVTPESFALALRPSVEQVIDPILKKKITIEKNSEVALILGELSTFLGKQKYNTGLVDKLTDLYDCKDFDSELTLSRGKMVFKNIYVTLFGATTMDGLLYSIPPEAMGGGFISRTVLVYAPFPERKYPRPFAVKGGPTDSDLISRIGWVAEYARGEYDFSPEADKAYCEWYNEFKDHLAEEGNKKKADIKQRYDIHLLKLALLLRAQRYEKGNIITLENFQTAQKLLQYTYSTSYMITQDVGENQYLVAYNKVKAYIEKKVKVTRRGLLQHMSPYGLDAEMLTRIIDHLHQAGVIKVKLNGEWKKSISKTGTELYVLSEYSDA